ncbi:MAG: hypothetical protein OXP28_11420, partial [Gammaproteobacteria bacterium]|nr:hypothetical protein [Gammaproteobacteria bacterium]
LEAGTPMRVFASFATQFPTFMHKPHSLDVLEITFESESIKSEKCPITLFYIYKMIKFIIP